MKVHHKILSIFIILAATYDIISAREEWVDPHDMNIKVKTVRKERHTNGNDENQESCNNFFQKDKSSIYLKKVVSLITDMTYFDRKSNVYKGIIDIHLEKDDFDFLKKYLSADLNDDYFLNRMSKVLEKSLEKDEYSMYFFSIGEYLYLMVLNENVVLTFGLIVLLYILWKIQPHNYRLTTLFKLFFPLVYISDFILRYKAKLEEAEIDQYLEYENFKPCDPDRLGWLDWIHDKFTGSCQKNKRNYMLSQRAATHVFTPLSVIGDQFDVLVTIFEHLGAGLGKFMASFIYETPWYFKLIAGIFSFILVIIILLMLGSYVFQISPKFNLFHMIQLEFSHNNRSIESNRNSIESRQDRVSGENLKMLLQSKKQNNPVVIVPGPSILKKNSAPTFKTKSRVTLKKISPAMRNSNNERLPISQGENKVLEID